MGTIYQSVKHGRWFDPSTWSPRGIPGQGTDDGVFIYHEITIDADPFPLNPLLFINLEDYPAKLLFTHQQNVASPTYRLRVRAGRLGDFLRGINIIYDKVIQRGFNHAFIHARTAVLQSGDYFLHHDVRVIIIFYVSYSDLQTNYSFPINYTYSYPFVVHRYLPHVKFIEAYRTTAVGGGGYPTLFLAESNTEILLYFTFTDTGEIYRITTEEALIDTTNIGVGEVFFRQNTWQSIEIGELSSQLGIPPSTRTVSSEDTARMLVRTSAIQLSSSSPISTNINVALDYQATEFQPAVPHYCSEDVNLTMSNESNPTGDTQNLDGEENVQLSHGFPAFDEVDAGESLSRVTTSPGFSVDDSLPYSYQMAVSLSPQQKVDASGDIPYSELVTPAFVASGGENNMNYAINTILSPIFLSPTLVDLPTKDIVNIPLSTIQISATEGQSYGEQTEIYPTMLSQTHLHSTEIAFSSPLLYLTDTDTFLRSYDEVDTNFTDLVVAFVEAVGTHDSVIFPNLYFVVDEDYLDSFSAAEVTLGNTYSVAEVTSLFMLEDVMMLLPPSHLSATQEISASEDISIEGRAGVSVLSSLDITLSEEVAVSRNRVVQEASNVFFSEDVGVIASFVCGE